MSTFNIENYIFIHKDKDGYKRSPTNTYIIPSRDTFFNIPSINNTDSTLIDTLKRDSLKDRFYADMIKDMGVPYSGTTSLASNEIKEIINIAFGNDSPFQNNNTENTNTYKSRILQQRYNKVTTEKVDSITIYRNILKTSTLAISGFSNAPYQFYESGLGVDKICANKTVGCKSVDTAAAHLDTAGKNKSGATAYFNMKIDPITFVSYGFPNDTEIETKWINVNDCQIKINGLPDASDLFIDLYPDIDDLLKPYTLGNAQKNKVLYNLLQNKNYQQDKAKMKNILLVKEFGDVLQVMKYYGIVTYLEEQYKLFDTNIDDIGAKKIIRPNFNMQTTDSVVFDLCVSLELPCTYTGSREGVTSGGISISIYEYVQTPPATIIRNRLTSIYQGFNGQLKSLKFAINSGLVLLSSLSYIVPDGYIAPGKRRSGRGTPNVFKILESADIFYPNEKIMHIIPNTTPAQYRPMSPNESVQLKRTILDLLLGAVNLASKNLEDNYNIIIAEIPSDDEEQVNIKDFIDTKTSNLQQTLMIRLNTDNNVWEQGPVNNEYRFGFNFKDNPPFIKATNGWIISDPQLIELFANYSGYLPSGVETNKINNYLDYANYNQDGAQAFGGNGKRRINPRNKSDIRRGKQLKNLIEARNQRRSDLMQKRRGIDRSIELTLENSIENSIDSSIELTLENCIYLREALYLQEADQITETQEDAVKLLALNFSEIQSESIVKPWLYPELLLKHGGYLEKKYDINGDLMVMNAETAIDHYFTYTEYEYDINGDLMYDRNGDLMVKGSTLIGYQAETNDLIAEIQVNNKMEYILVTVNISEDKAKKIMDAMNIFALNHLHIADVSYIQEVKSLMDKYISKFNSLLNKGKAMTRLGFSSNQDESNNQNKSENTFYTGINKIQENTTLNDVLDGTLTQITISRNKLEFENQKVVYNNTEFDVVTVNPNNTFTIQDIDNNYLTVPTTEILILDEQKRWIEFENFLEVGINQIVMYENTEYNLVRVNPHDNTLTIQDINNNYLTVPISDFINNQILMYKNTVIDVETVNLNDNTLTIKDINDNYLTVPTNKILILYGQNLWIPISDFINNQIDVFGNYYDSLRIATYNYGKITDTVQIDSLNSLFSRWSTEFNKSITSGGKKNKRKITKKKRKQKKHTKKIKFRKKSSKKQRHTKRNRKQN